MGGERIFVYGTLRRGGTRDMLRFYDDVKFVSAASVRGWLYDLGAYPGLRCDEAADAIAGDVFEVSPRTLAQLDEWEMIDQSAPDAGEYRRVRVVAALVGAGVESCWGYEISADRCEGRPMIASGDWIAHAATRG